MLTETESLEKRERREFEGEMEGPFFLKINLEICYPFFFIVWGEREVVPWSYGGVFFCFAILNLLFIWCFWGGTCVCVLLVQKKFFFLLFASLRHPPKRETSVG